MVDHVEGGFEVEEGCIKVLMVEGCVLYVVDQVEDLAVCAPVGPKSFLGSTQDV